MSFNTTTTTAERPDVSYSLLAVDFMPDGAVQSALSRIAHSLSQGTLQPLPQAVHSLNTVQAALRQMSQARHVGKIVVRMPTSAALPSAAASAAGTVLVTGGLGTLGSLTAAWLATSSKLHVHATGRSGRFTSTNSLSALIAAGFSGILTLTSADASCVEDAVLLTDNRNVVGVVHASGVLADATLRNQSLIGMRTVFGPKVSALQQLDSGTTATPGCFQILFSSVASLLGSPGQANYSAANSLLDAMSQANEAQVCRVFWVAVLLTHNRYLQPIKQTIACL